MAAMNQLSSWIMSKMSAVFQLTDTDAGQPFKAFANEGQHQVRRELKAAAEQTGVHAVYKQGTYEVLKITYFALKKLRHYMDIEIPRTIEGCIRNCALSYIPDYEARRLRRVTELPWASEMKAGSHRISSSWAEHRFDWLDEKGRPSPATSEGMGPVSEVADMEEHTYQFEEG